MPDTAESPWAFAAPDTPTYAYLVINPRIGGMVQATLDEDRAHKLARDIGCVVARLNVVADFQAEAT